MSLAEDLLELLPMFSAAERAEVSKLLTVRAPLWVPQIGPQLCARDCPADILFYGGQAGGGKSDLLLGVALTQQEHSILFRREAVQLVGLVERMARILGSRAGFNSQTNVWRLPGSRVLEFGSVAQPDDWMKYQGRPHDAKCLGAGTPILMADDTYKVIERIVVGDMVATLEGPRRVTNTFRMRRQAVLASAYAGSELKALQVQSATHELLSAGGWVAPGRTPDRVASSPTQRRCACRSEGSSSPTCSPGASTQPGQCHHEEQPQAQPPDRAGCRSSSGFCAGAGQSSQGSGSAGSGYRPSDVWQRLSGIVRRALQRPFPWLSAQGSAQPSGAHGASDARAAPSPEGCEARCSTEPHRGGEQPRQAEEADPTCLLLSGGVEQQSPSCSAVDGRDGTPTHTRRVEGYFHPYTREKRRTWAEFVEASLVFAELGERNLFDLTVEEVNHYISAGGFVNRNCFDEIPHFLESQFRALIGWMRTDDPKVRQRVIAVGNPPTDSDGEWIVQYWAPWLDPKHHNPAKWGDLRWFVTDAEGEDLEVPDKTPVKIKGRMVQPRSRTFIPSGVTDNLYLLKTGYADTLMSLPEPLRSMMAEGRFDVARADHVWQIIPTEWVDAAMARWAPRERNKGLMTRLGFDVARGGRDRSTVARRHGNWIDELVTAPGVVTNDGPKASALVAPLLRDRCPVSVDGIGIGSSAVDFMRGLGMRVSSVVMSEGSTGRTKTGDLFFKNKRAELYWRLREAMDPALDDPIALPPDKELREELIAHRYKVVQMGSARAGILVRDKDEVREVLGRSPDKADAVVMTEDRALPSGSQDQAEKFRKLRGLS